MRVLHVLHSLDQLYGGPLRAVLDLSARSMVLGLDSELLGFGPLSIPDNPLPSEKIHSLPIGVPRTYLYSPYLADWIRHNLARFDGVILHGMWLYPNWAFFMACRKAQIPYICFPHGMLEPWALYGQGPIRAIKKTIYWLIRERAIFVNSSAVFFTTERERSLALATFSLPPSSFIVVPYGVGVLSAPADHPARAELNIPADRKVSLFLGRVHPKKNVDFLIEAWAKAKLDPKWLLIVAGPCEPRYQAALDLLVHRYEMSQQVRFVQAVSGQDKAYLFGRASWFLLPSKQENFGISVLEAVNAGCPVAISDQVYLADSFHRNSEILPLDLDAWVEFLRNRMPDEQHRQRLIKLDQIHIVPRFTLASVTKNWVATISTAIGASFEARKNGQDANSRR